jgi:hypothetical protein
VTDDVISSVGSNSAIKFVNVRISVRRMMRNAASTGERKRTRNLSTWKFQLQDAVAAAAVVAVAVVE